MKPMRFLWKRYKNQLIKQAKKIKTHQSFFARQSLILIVTSKCNFSCKHCLVDFNDTRDLPFEIAQKAILGAKRYNFKNVVLTGGEPFLYSRFKELIEFIVKNNYTFSLVTNGWNFKKFADFLKRYKDRIASIAFSLESVDKKLHDFMRRQDSFDRLMEDFRICRKYKIPFEIVTAIGPSNYGEILDISIFAKGHGAKCVAFTTMLPCPRTQKNKLVLDAAKRQELFSMLRGLYKITKLPVDIAADIRANSNIKLCLALNMNEVTVDVDGNLVHCCELAGYDSKSISHGAVATSLKDKSFDEALKILSEYIHKFICGRIEDYKIQPDTDHIDFNSCFYCVDKLGK